MKLVTRKQLGWPASAAPTQATTRGVKVHYEGTFVSKDLLTDHNRCLAEWTQIRTSHLANKTEGYSDVAYNYAACPHGYLLEGRGIGHRTGANGNQELNRAHYAILGLVGSSGLTEPTDAMLSAIRDGIELLRLNGAGDEIKGHRDGYPTACPGGPLYAWVKKGAPRPGGQAPELKPPAKGGTYTVKPGDTLSAIGTTLGIAWPDLAKANNIRTPYRIVPGQILKVPDTAPSKLAPAKPKVSLAHVVSAARHDPPAAQGHTSYKNEVLIVERALKTEGLLDSQYVDGSFGTRTITAYAAWQRKLGYTGSAADGIPGKTSLTRLGDKHGFTVTT